MRRLGPPTLLLACLAALIAPGAAQAARDQTVLFEAPRDLLDAQSRPGALRQLDQLGVRALRVVLLWNNVAPSPDAATRPGFDATDPSAYHWGQYDDVLAAARERGWQVLLTVSGPVPRWATAGGVDHVTRPDAQEFQAFMTAVGRRYGQQIKLFSIWNEPNEPIFLGPQFQNGAPASPRIYRGLFQAGVAGLRASGNFSGTRVLMGETAPRGTGHVVAPLTFLRGALCLDSHYRRASSCSALPADGYAHHAYTTAAGPGFKPPGANDVTIGVLPRLTTALDRAAAAGAIRAGLPIYLTEFGIQSKPDPFVGVPLAQQAEFQALSERIAYNTPRVRFFSQYLLRDDVPRPGSSLQRYSGFESGLEFADGGRKPSYSAWPVPVAVTRSGGRVSLWGLARPARAATNVEVQVADGKGGFRHLLSAHTNSLGYWTAHSTYRHGRRWRVRWTSPDGVAYVGPPIRAYDSAGRLAA
ncbi:MAG: hypothetical protein QOE44_436 [Solirubrobacteraceae bacterium]|nr:hypothetical protein [Solirubrobacteraceae bacterium]